MINLKKKYGADFAVAAGNSLNHFVDLTIASGHHLIAQVNNFSFRGREIAKATLKDPADLNVSYWIQYTVYSAYIKSIFMNSDYFEYRDDGVFHQVGGGYQYIFTDRGQLVKRNKQTGEDEFDKDVLAEDFCRSTFKHFSCDSFRLKKWVYRKLINIPVRMLR